MRDLNIEYFDLYLIHFPICLRFVPFEVRYPPSWVYNDQDEYPKIELESVPLSETWTAMEELKERGIAKDIGISSLSLLISIILADLPLLSHTCYHPFARL